MGSHEKSDGGISEFARTRSPQGNCVSYFCELCLEETTSMFWFLGSPQLRGTLLAGSGALPAGRLQQKLQPVLHFPLGRGPGA